MKDKRLLLGALGIGALSLLLIAWRKPKPSRGSMSPEALQEYCASDPTDWSFEKKVICNESRKDLWDTGWVDGECRVTDLVGASYRPHPSEAAAFRERCGDRPRAPGGPLTAEEAQRARGPSFNACIRAIPTSYRGPQYWDAFNMCVATHLAGPPVEPTAAENLGMDPETYALYYYIQHNEQRVGCAGRVQRLRDIGVFSGLRDNAEAAGRAKWAAMPEVLRADCIRDFRCVSRADLRHYFSRWDRARFVGTRFFWFVSKWEPAQLRIGIPFVGASFH